MKQTLQIKLGQNLTMTPQLQQAIKLLQLSTKELATEIQEALDTNPLLETAEDDVPVETTWDNTYPTGTFTSSNPSQDKFDAISLKYAIKDLQEHLLWQMQLSPFSLQDQQIALTIIDAINDNGYLTISLTDVLDSLDISADDNTGIEEILAVLHRIQHFDPLGVGARSLQECLSIQLNTLDPNTTLLTAAKQLVQQHLELLAKKNYTKLRRKLKLTTAQLQQTVKLITSLTPNPGSSISNKTAAIIIPDVLVRREAHRWLVELNLESIPKLRINNYYSKILTNANSAANSQYLRKNMHEAKWLLKTIYNRNEILLKVASYIVEHQRGFLEYGAEAIKPLILTNVAANLNIHESTVSRITTNKFIHTPQGVYELKYFFSNHITTDGGECSATAIRALIKKLISTENNLQPLSDNKLVTLLAEHGINIARRTVAKYRDLLAIAPASQRKSLL